jgi:hypothetical protein
VLVTDPRGDVWIEEYSSTRRATSERVHLGALGRVTTTRDGAAGGARRCGIACVRTLEARLDDFDTGWWSLYEAPTTGQPMLASLYYHRLHAVQLRVSTS